MSVRPDPNIFVIRPVIARLSPGTSIEAARRELESTLARLPSTADEKPGTQITDGSSARRLARRQGETVAVDLQRRRFVRSADRVRERREPAAHSRVDART